MAYKYASNTFLVPTGYQTDLTLVPNMIANWLKSTFSLTEHNVSTGTNSNGYKYHYIYLRVPETDILVEEGVYSNGSMFFMTVGRIGAVQSSYGFSISANSIIQVAIAQLYPDFIILNPSVGSGKPIASLAMIMQELSTGVDRILVRNAYMGSSGDAAGFNIFLPERYGWLEDGSFKYADYSLFPSSLSTLKGSVEKETGNKDKCLLMTPVLYSTTSPVGAVVAKNDRLKLVINNDDTLPKETGEVPITIGTKHYIGVTNSTYAYICVDGRPAAGMAVPAAGENRPRRSADLHIGVHDPGHLPHHMSALAGGNTVKERVTMKKLMFALFDRVLGFGRLLEAGREELILDD